MACNLKDSKIFFFELENQLIEMKDCYPAEIPVSFGNYNFGQSGSYLIVAEGSGIDGDQYDSGTAVVKINHKIPAGRYDIWYRVTTGREGFLEDSKWYAWVEWPGGRSKREDLGPIFRANPCRTFKWVKIAKQVLLPELDEKEFMCIGMDDDKTNPYHYAIWDAICLSNTQDFIPPEEVPVGGWERNRQLLPSETIPIEEKKIITFGGASGDDSLGGCPIPSFVVNSVDKMEATLPVDGILMTAGYKIDKDIATVHNNFFTPNEVTWEATKDIVENLKNIRFDRFKDNFLRVNAVPGLPEGIDWFDDEIWATITDKWRLIVRIVKEDDLKGVFFDTEQYSGAHNGKPFMYSRQLHSTEKSFEEYSKEVRKRGRQLMEAIQDIYPDITIIFTYATSLLALPRIPSSNLSLVTYGLLPALVDGFLEGGPDATIVDGCEGAYLYKRYQRFVGAYRFIKEKSAALSQIPEIYRERIKVGFGLWVERFKPEELKYALHYALRVSDGYVWLYMSRIKSWSLTPEIEDICKDVSWAINEARQEQALDKN